jgi:translocation and assembly module TamB
MTRLADLAPLIGQKIEGALAAKLATTAAGPKPEAKIDLQATNLALGSNAVAHLSLAGQIRDPAAAPDASLTLTADGIAASGITGQAHATLTGPQTALLLHTDAALNVRNFPATQSATARLDVPAHLLTLTTLDAAYRGETLYLRTPARLSFGPQTAIDRLLLAFGPANTPPATLDIAGRLAPQLALTAALRHVTPALAKPFTPTLTAVGNLTADATLAGTTAAPTGTIRLQALGLSLKNGPLGFLVPATIRATATLDGHSAQIDAHAAAGPKLTASLSGTAPLQPTGPVALHVALATDLSQLNPILGATGQRAAGNLAVDATLTGTPTTPLIRGRITLDRGEIQDYVQGVHITDIAAHLTGAGDSIRLDTLTAKAGPGTLAATGTIGILAPALPIDLHFTANNARPLTSDLLTATLDADLRLTGQATQQLSAAGHVFVRSANINIPNAFPPSVAVLHVRRPGDKPPPAIPRPAVITQLAIDVDAPSQIFVRGHGLDSELGGKLTIAGTTAAPQIGGGFDMRRGSISVAGTTLDFSTGKVGFDGTSVTNKIDPTLDFVADSTAGGVTATLAVGGYADAPTIKLSSVPDLPQDEVLAQLLFGTSVKDLSAIQIAEIASALAELTGVTGSGSDPLGAVRRGLGLDRLSVGGGSGSGTGATVEAGRYVARGVYIGAKQATSGGGTAAEVQVDITRHLKAKAQLATGGGTVQGATPDNDPGSTVGLSYQFEY